MPKGYRGTEKLPATNTSAPFACAGAKVKVLLIVRPKPGLVAHGDQTAETGDAAGIASAGL